MFGSGQIFCLVSFQQNSRTVLWKFWSHISKLLLFLRSYRLINSRFLEASRNDAPGPQQKNVFFYPTRKINDFKGDCKAQIVSGKTYSRTCIGWSPCIKRPVFKIPNLFPLSITVIFTSIGRLPLLSSRGHLWVSPIGLFVSSFVRVERSLKAGPLKWNLE